MGVAFALLQMAFDVFDNHDGVVNHQARGQRNSEQRQGVDGKSQQLNECEGANQRNRNCNGGNDGRPPVFKKDKYDEDDERNCLKQGGQNIANGFSNGIRGIESILIFHAGRKVFRQAIQFRDCQAIYLKRVGVGELQDAKTHSFATIEHQIRAIVLGAQFGASHIAQAYERAIFVGFKDDVFKLAWLIQAAHDSHTDLKRLSTSDGRLTDLAGGHFDVLLRQRTHHVRCRQSATGHAHGIKPQPHRILALSENNYVGHSLHSFQGVPDVNVEVVAHE